MTIYLFLHHQERYTLQLNTRLMLNWCLVCDGNLLSRPSPFKKRLFLWFFMQLLAEKIPLSHTQLTLNERNERRRKSQTKTLKSACKFT